MDFKHKFETETGNSIYSGNGQMLPEGSYSDDFVEYLLKQLTLYDVVISCVDKETLIEDLNDKRIVGKTIDENMWHYCRKETAQHLLDKYEIRPK